MRYVLIVLLTLASCKDHLKPIKETVYYDIAVKSLEKTGVLKHSMVEKETLESHERIIYGKDTILLQLSKRVFALQDERTDKIYVFHFYQNRGFNRYDLSSDWKVLSMVVSTGEGVYIHDDEPVK